MILSSDLEDASVEQLVNEIIDRVENGCNSKMDNLHINRLKTVLEADAFGAENLAEVMKVEYLAEIFDKYTEDQFRTAIDYWEFQGKPNAY